MFQRKGSRNVPTLVNRAYGKSLFWDGRTEDLETQVLLSMEDPREMDLLAAEAMVLLSQGRGYSKRFRAAFGLPERRLTCTTAAWRR